MHIYSIFLEGSLCRTSPEVIRIDTRLVEASKTLLLHVVFPSESDYFIFEDEENMHKHQIWDALPLHAPCT